MIVFICMVISIGLIAIICYLLGYKAGKEEYEHKEPKTNTKRALEDANYGKRYN